MREPLRLYKNIILSVLRSNGIWPVLQTLLNSLNTISEKGSQLRSSRDVSFVVIPWMSAAPDLFACSRMVFRERLSAGKVMRSVSGCIGEGEFCGGWLVTTGGAGMFVVTSCTLGGSVILASVW